MNSRAYTHPSQPPHPHQQSHQAHQPHPGHPVAAPVAPYAAALQGQIPAGSQSRHVFAQAPNPQNAGQGPAAGPPPAGPGPMMHAAPGPQMVGQQNQQQSYQNAGPQQAIRSAFVPQGQQVPQNRPQMQQMHQQQQQVQHQQAQNAAAAAAMQHMVVFPGYGQHMVHNVYQAGAGQAQGPILSIPSASIQSINYQPYGRMPFGAGAQQQQMLNHYQLSHHYGQIPAYGQPYVMAQQPPPQQQPQPPQAQQHASQQQAPQQQQAVPQRGHPLPSPSPVNAGMVIQVAHESGNPNKVPGVAIPSSVPNPQAPPFKPRPKKMALLQDPETMEIVDLVKPASGSDASVSSTSLRSTPSADSVKAEAAAAADAAVPEPAKTLPNNAHPAPIAVDFMNKVALVASEPVKPAADAVTAAASVKSEPEPVPVVQSQPAAEKVSLKPANREPDAKPVPPEPAGKAKEEEKRPVVAEAVTAAAGMLDAKENITPLAEQTEAVSAKPVPRHVDREPKQVTTTAVVTTTTTTTAAPVAPGVKAVPAQTAVPAAVVAKESEAEVAVTKSSHVPVVETPPATSPAAKPAAVDTKSEPVTLRVNGEIPQPPEDKAPVATVPAAVAKEKVTPSSVPASKSDDAVAAKEPAAVVKEETPLSKEVVAAAPVVPSAQVVEDVNAARDENGVFRYSREALIEYAKLPISHTRPAELTDEKLHRMRGTRAGGGGGGSGGAGGAQLFDFTPSFVQRGPGGGGGGGGGGQRPGPNPRPMGYPGRMSLDMERGPKKIIPSLNLHQDVKLHTVENAWKPVVGKKEVDANDEETKTVLLLKNFRGFLNKITPQKYDVIEGKIKDLTIDTEDRMERVLNLIFDKAVDEPAFCKQYALLCQHLGSRHVTKVVVKDEREVEEKVEFRRLLIQRCQHDFERDIYQSIDLPGREKEIEECEDAEKKRLLAHELDEEKRRARKKSLGNMKLIGELYRLQMLKAVIMVNCVHKLISEIEDDNLECLCTLLRTIGQQLETETQQRENTKDIMDKYFNRLNVIASSAAVGGKVISPRVKCLIKDIIDLRNNRWQERGIHKDNVPKTIDQIHKDVKNEAQKNMQDDLDYQQSRGDQRRHPRVVMSGQSYGSRSLPGNQHYEKDISGVLASLKAATAQKKPEGETVTLGPTAMGMWGQGSNAKTPNAAPAGKSSGGRSDDNAPASDTGRRKE